MAKYIVATIDEIPPGTRKIVDVAGRQIGVFNIKGEFFALRNRCPHQGGPLCEGQLSGLLEASVPGPESMRGPTSLGPATGSSAHEQPGPPRASASATMWSAREER